MRMVILLNNVDLVGRIVRDPELRYIPGTGTPVASFTIAAERDFLKKDGTRDTDFIPCELIGRSAEYAATWCLQGSLVEFHGSIRVDRYEKNGENRTFTKVSGSKIKHLARPGKAKEEGQVAENEQQTYGAVEDPDIPF